MMLVSLLITMTLSGVIGGLINFLLAEAPAPPTQRLQKWWQYVLIGLGASFVMPLFLNTISSPLVGEIIGSEFTAQSASKLLVMAGFCILAAVSSRTFMQSLAARVLRVAEEAKKQSDEALATSNEARHEVGLVVEPQAKESEDIPYTRALELATAAEAFQKGAVNDEGSTWGTLLEQALVADPSRFAERVDVTADEEKTLAHMMVSKYVYRTLVGLVKATGFNPTRMTDVLRSLKDKGLVAESSADVAEVPRYRITARGQKAVWDSQEKQPK